MVAMLLKVLLKPDFPSQYICFFLTSDVSVFGLNLKLKNSQN